MAGWRTATHVCLAAGLLAATLALTGGTFAYARSPSTLHVDPHGTGTSCTASNPCGDLASAVAVSQPGDVVQAAGGDYGPQMIRASVSQQPADVVVRSMPGQQAVFGDTIVQRPGVSFRSVTFHGSLILREGDDVVDRIRMIAGTLLVRNDDVAVLNSVIEGGAAHDGINVAGRPLHNVLIEGNTVRDIGQGSGLQQHPDCLQVFDADHVRILRNNFYNCWNSGITFSPGAQLGITNVLVESNFVQGCLPARQSCSAGGAAMDLRTTQARSVVVRNNTFGEGSVRLPDNPGVIALDNIVGYLSVAKPCTTSLTDSLVAAYPAAFCRNGVPGTTLGTHSGNISGHVSYVDQDAGNLHLAGKNPPRITPGSGTKMSLHHSVSRDIDGTVIRPGTLGADQPAKTTTAAPTSSTPPASGTTAIPARPLRRHRDHPIHQHHVQHPRATLTTSPAASVTILGRATRRATVPTAVDAGSAAVARPVVYPLAAVAALLAGSLAVLAAHRRTALRRSRGGHRA